MQNNCGEKVMDSDGIERDCLFRVRRNTRMKRLMEVYEERTNTSTDSRTFYFDGKPILDDDTPESLGMHNPGFAYVVVSFSQFPEMASPT